MASLRKVRDTENPTIKFLYTILKQVDTKLVDWQEVADQLEITNGHAVRMRYHRFKQLMKGLPQSAHKSKSAAPRQKKAISSRPSTPKKETKKEQQSRVSGEFRIKIEVGEEVETMQETEPSIKPKSPVKDELLIKSEPEGEEGGM